MFTYVLVFLLLLVALFAIYAIRRQARITQTFTAAEQILNTKVFEASTQKVEATVVEKLAEKARDPRLSSMTQEDLVLEVLKDCYDPEIPLNVVDLGLVYEVKVHSDAVDVKISMTSPMCPSHVAISEDIKTKLNDAGFPNPKIEVVWEPAWSPQRISEAGRKALGI